MRRSWLYAAAAITWVVVSIPTLLEVLRGELSGVGAVAFVAAFAAFGLSLFACLLFPQRLPHSGRVGAVVIQTAAGLAMVRTGDGLASATLVVVAAQLPYLLPTWATVTWTAMQTIMLAWLFAAVGERVNAIVNALALGAFQWFAVATSSLALSERRAREELARASATLLATGELLAENTKVGERLRISRDLHDSLGHHLTALSLQLDVASRLATGNARAHVVEAHAITRLLLSDVRGVVSELRASGAVELSASLRRLGDAAGDVKLHLALPEPLAVDDPRQAQVLFRAVQEIVTNAARHAHARNLWIRIERSQSGFMLSAKDDGVGAAAVTLGNGLLGMRERFEALSGRLDVASSPGGGFEVTGFLPGAEPVT